MFEKSLEEEMEAQEQLPVECLGMTFQNDDARREHFLRRLREGLEELHDKLAGVPFTTVNDAVERMRSPEKWPMGDDARLRYLAQRMQGADSSKDLLQLWQDEVGFPHGEIDDILRLSDPPYYTACPNPFLPEFVRQLGSGKRVASDHSREPYAADVSQSRNDPYVNAHSYATKVPPQAVLRYLLYYTEPGDIVYDGYCGTAMTAVAAQLAADPPPDIKAEIEQEWAARGWADPVWGARAVVAGDLSPAATFIGGNLTGRDDLAQFASCADDIQRQVEQECGWMYKTVHTDGSLVDIDVVLWSDVFVCPECSSELVYWDSAVDLSAGRMLSNFACPGCGALLNKRGLPHAYESRFDEVIGGVAKLPKRVPVSMVYYVGQAKHEKRPDEYDLQLLRRIDDEEIDRWFPRIMMMNKGARWGDTWRSGYHDGITHLHQFFTRRNLKSLAFAWHLADTSRLRFMLTALMYKSSLLCGPLMSNYFAEHHGKTRGGWVGKERSGTLFRPSISSEVPIHKQIASRKLSTAVRARANDALCLQTVSATASGLPDESVDHVFIDPPFGANRYYAELNFLWEAWLRVFTRQGPEAVQSPHQGKDLATYQQLMHSGFAECFRVLKPGRWMTVEFSNTSAAVWNAIQTAMTQAGFVVADVRGLSKGQGSINAYTTPTAVRQDLVISAYRPDGGLEERFTVTAGTEAGVWDFLRTHLRQLPISVHRNGQLEVIAERQNFMLFDRMVAFHVQRGVTVPLSAGEFYAGLAQRFPERDEMYFLPEQVAAYDKQRMTAKELRQLQLIVNDEASAIQWLKQQLTQKPQTFQEVHPQFMRELGGWVKHEKPLELLELLRENFLCYEGKDEVPSQIHGYLSSNFRDLRKLPKHDPGLQAKAKDRWYVPDPNKAADLEKLRERSLLREFWEYLPPGHKPAKRDATQTTLPGLDAGGPPISKGSKMRIIRLEAVRAGFKHCWQERDYRTIIAVARRIPENVLQEDPKLLMWYDQAVTRTGEG